jgi:uncharacterized RDD family membrane protein YckC
MQCPSCRAVFSNGLDVCPRCKTPASKSSSEPDAEQQTLQTQENLNEAVSAEATTTTMDASPAITTPTASTLIEFPGVSRASRPQWRKELSERVREIQQRRAGAGGGAPTREAEEVAQKIAEQPADESVVPQLGLVPPQDAPEVNPIVAAALKRLERARQTYPPMPRTRASMSGGAATAVARVTEEQYRLEAGTAPAAPLVPGSITEEQSAVDAAAEAKTAKPAREHTLVVVPAQPVTKEPASKPQPKRDKAEATKEAAQKVQPTVETSEPLIEEEPYDDRAPIVSRIAGSLIDLLVIAFASSPFAAIIELTNGNWADWRVLASMGGIILIVMFLYLTAATALAGRTWGMSLVSLRAVDADTGLPPTTRQAVVRASLYIASLITLGLGILYALFDAEGRTIHDYLSGTAVVRE